jgi:predicted nucleotidyltransferase
MKTDPVSSMISMHNEIINYFRDRQEIVAIYLFGSYSAGRERAFSDVDIGILFDGSEEIFVMEKRNTYMTELGRILRKDIHPVILNRAGEELLRQVFLKGTCLLVNNPAKLAKFKMNALVRITEFAYYRKKMEQGFMRKIMGVAVG